MAMVAMDESPVPFDYQAATGIHDWSRALRWPSDPRSAAPLVQRILGAYMTRAASEDVDASSKLMLASASVLAYAIVYAEAAFVAQGAEAKGISLVGGPIEMQFLRGEIDADGLPRANVRVFSGRTPRWARLRQLKISASMAGLRGLWGNIVAAPVAISRNGLLDAHSRHGAAPVRFRHAESILETALSSGAPRRQSDNGLADLVSAACRDVADAVGLEAPYEERFLALLNRFAVPHTLAAAAQLDACIASDATPDIVYSGTAGAYAARLIGLAAMRRGGGAVRFDHGGPSLLASTNNLNHCQVEDSVSSEVVLPSVALVTAAETSYRDTPFSDRSIVFRAGIGDAGYALASSGRRTANRSRNVLYVPTLLSGFWQYILPDLPDVVNLDWQLRLAAQLARLPISLCCKPHPEGVLGGRRNPLEDVARVSSARFEDHLADTDLYVLDLMSSTTFWKAMCTDRPVVYIDLGINRFADWIYPAIAARCVVLKASYDERNLPHVDQQELEHAVMTAPAQSDGGPIRRLLGVDS